jgi:phosphate transport system substrate-binding protein
MDILHNTGGLAKLKNLRLIVAPLIICLVVIPIMCSACSSGNGASTTSGTTGPVLAGTISESGSTTVQPLAEKLAGAFSAINPKVKITIQGGGTAVGIKAANDGTVNIGAASRELTSADPALNKFLLAKDGIALIINPANPVKTLSKSQIKDIYSGRISRWSQLGGPDKEITVAAREEGSGTRTAFEDMVMGKDTLISKKAILQNSNGAIVQVVRTDANAIGFVSFGYLTDNSIQAVIVEGVAATETNAKNGTYPVVRPLYFLTKNSPVELVKAFLDYCAGADAQKIIIEEGYVAVY